MIRRYDFKCDNEHTDEYWVDHTVETTPCSVCGEPAARLIATPTVSLDPISGDFAGATIKWARQREKQIAKERRANS
jgi:hypothetical protein